MVAADKTGPIDIVRHRILYLAISAILLVPGVVFMGQSIAQFQSPVRLGLDFVGGTLLEYGVQTDLKPEQLPSVRNWLDDKGYAGAIVQVQDAPVPVDATTPSASADTKELDASPTALKSVLSIRTKPLSEGDASALKTELTEQFGQLTLLQKNAVGPTLAAELLKNGLIALLFAYLLIFGYLTYRFQLDYAVCAMLALVHDTLFVMGVFAALGILLGIEVNSLFVTGILTVIGFSVHDTIVVFDRLRENARLLYSKKLPFAEIANLSVNQTLARSINTSVTSLIPLFALWWFGGGTTRDLVLTMILGIIIGTYSSICVASLILAWWREKQTAQQGGAALNAKEAMAN